MQMKLQYQTQCFTEIIDHQTAQSLGQFNLSEQLQAGLKLNRFSVSVPLQSLKFHMSGII